MLSLTTLARVKVWLEIPETNDTYDSVFSMLIASVSAQINRHLNGRHIEQVSRTELFDNEQLIRLAGYPVSSVTSVKFDPDQEFTDAHLLTTKDYRINKDSGVLELRIQVTGEYPQSVQVVYTGGMAATTEALAANYPDIEEAALIQIDHMHKHRGNLGAVSTGGNGGSVTFNDTAGLIKPVKDILKLYRRVI